MASMLSKEKPMVAKGWFHLCLWSFGMFIAVFVAMLTDKAIPPGSVTLFGMVIGAYTANKTFVKLSQGKSSGEVRIEKRGKK